MIDKDISDFYGKSLPSSVVNSDVKALVFRVQYTGRGEAVRVRIPGVPPGSLFAGPLSVRNIGGVAVEIAGLGTKSDPSRYCSISSTVPVSGQLLSVENQTDPVTVEESAEGHYVLFPAFTGFVDLEFFFYYISGNSGL